MSGAKRALAFTLTYYSSVLVLFAIAIWHYSTASVNVDVVNIGFGADRGCPCRWCCRGSTDREVPASDCVCLTCLGVDLLSMLMLSTLSVLSVL